MKALCIFILLCTVLGVKQIYASAPAAESAAPRPEKLKSESGSLADRGRLTSALFESYDKRNYPDTDLKFGIALNNVHFDEDDSTMNADIWLKMEWTDSRLEWTKEDFNVGVLRLPSDEVWKPDISLYNSAKGRSNMDCWHSNVLVYPNGEVLWVPPCQISAFCNHTLDTAPYAPQTCLLKFGSWTFDANTMPIKIFNNITEADLSENYHVSDWEITGNHAEVVHRYYSCCEEPYATAEFNITVQRKPSPHNSQHCSRT